MRFARQNDYNNHYADQHEAEDEREKQIQFNISNYGCSYKVAEYMTDNNCDIQEAEEMMSDKG